MESAPEHFGACFSSPLHCLTVSFEEFVSAGCFGRIGEINQVCCLFSLSPQATSLHGRLPNRYAHQGKYVSVSVCVCVSVSVSERGWLRKRCRCVFLNHICLAKQTGRGRSAYDPGLGFLFTVKSIVSALTPHQLEEIKSSLHLHVHPHKHLRQRMQSAAIHI